jgi:hypothetical protein
VEPAASILALKHARIRPDDGGYTLRGAKAWEGAVDSVVFQTKLPGRPWRGLTPTKLSPHKTRAYGLREPLRISPQWVGEGGSEGILLERGNLNVEENQQVTENAPSKEATNESLISNQSNEIRPKRRRRKWRSQ